MTDYYIVGSKPCVAGSSVYKEHMLTINNPPDTTPTFLPNITQNSMNMNQVDTPVQTAPAKMSLRELSRNRKKQFSQPDETINTMLSCQGCGAKPLVPADGYMVCNSCGLCQSRDIDSSQEWRNHDNTDKGGVDQSRVCMPNNSLMPDSGLGTVVGYSSSKKNNTTGAHIVRTMNNWKLMNYKESSMYRRFKYITTVCRQAEISNMIIEEAKIVFFKISNLISARRTKLTSLMATAVIIAHKIKGYDRDMTDIAALFALDVRILRKMVKEYERIWKEILEKESDEQDMLASESIVNHIEFVATAGTVAATSNSSASDLPTKKTNMSSGQNMQHVDSAGVSTPTPAIIQQQQPPASDNKKMIIDDNKKLKKYLIQLNVESIYFDDVFRINEWVINKNVLISHIPKSRYACLIYLLDQIYELGVEKSGIIRACDTSNVTINKCFNKLVPFYEEIKALLSAD